MAIILAVKSVEAERVNEAKVYLKKGLKLLCNQKKIETSLNCSFFDSDKV